MVDYKCASCKKNINCKLITNKIRCPYCNSKFLQKIQNRILEPIKAI